MTIACAQSAPYKMYKLAHTTTAQNQLGIVTTVAQRRALLNAWTSNVCGTGQAFTHQGEPITLHESLDLLPPASPYSVPAVTSEARWNEYGAICLDHHRLEEDEPDIYARIKTECGGKLPPPCDTPGLPAGHVRTGNP
jgi:hypothetical protein